MFIARENNKINLTKQDGFTLLEALISFFVLSVGLIGIVSLLTLSKSTQHQSLQRTRAIALANDLLERIRSNPGGIQIYGSRNTHLHIVDPFLECLLIILEIINIVI